MLIFNEVYDRLYVQQFLYFYEKFLHQVHEINSQIFILFIS